ncbi:MAG: hypothetical protein OXN97_05200 [Bryobacterales bacterium]|nr:hypothetical protein [Bryobacterales bacterium]MDE0627440.1 hypothetical protein [Bryobacterales bacterium]
MARQPFVDLLDERHRRLFADLTPLGRGHGADRQAAALIGLHPSTEACGRHRVERSPALSAALAQLLQHDTACDLCGGLC